MIKEIIINEDYKNQMLDKLSNIGFVNFLDKKKDNYEQVCSIINGELRDLIIKYANRCYSFPAIVIRGLPIDQYLPATPSVSKDITFNPLLAELIILSIVNNLGIPIGFKSENNGAIIHNISPRRDKSGTKSSSGAKEPMGMHSDFAFSDDRPDWLILMCLRNNDNIPTRVSVVNEICEKLTQEEIEVLKSPKFMIFPPDSSLAKEPKIAPILSFINNNYITRFNKDKCIGVDDISSNILNKFAYIADRLGKAVLLKSGEVLILDNKLMLHSRQSFNARYDGSDRWLQRVYCKSRGTLDFYETKIYDDVLTNEVA